MTTNRWFVAAAVLVFVAAWMPYWGFRMSAPQYPDEALMLSVSRHGIEGDVHEVKTLQKFIGVRFPEEIHELEWLPLAIVSLAFLIAAAAFAGSGWPGVAVRWVAVFAFCGLLFLSGSIVHARLYAVGHDRDPHAPIRAIKDFTPRLIGPTTIGNFTVWSFPHLGGIALAIAAAMTVTGAARGRHV